MARPKTKHIEDLTRISDPEKQTLTGLCDEVVSETAQRSSGSFSVIVKDRPECKIRIVANITTESEWAKVVIDLASRLGKRIDEVNGFSPKLPKADRNKVLRALDKLSAKVRKASNRLTYEQPTLFDED